MCSTFIVIVLLCCFYCLLITILKFPCFFPDSYLVYLDSVVALLDLASEHLECSALVIALERANSALKELLHSFLYVGASVVTKPHYPLDNAYVLVGIEC